VNIPDTNYLNTRLLNQVLTLYYIEEKSQAEVAQILGLSTAKVNRLLKQARDQGLVEISIRMPTQHLFDLESQLQQLSGIDEALIIPRMAEQPEAVLQTVGRAAADYVLQKLRDGDIICISGGKSMHALVQAMEPRRKYKVQVVPATGARQGRYYTDVNYLAERLAERLGGEAYKIHAPVFTDTPEERDMLLSLRQISEVLELARQAQIAIVGVGSVIPLSSSYFDLMSTSIDIEAWKAAMDGKHQGLGEIFAYIYDSDGALCMPQFNQRVVGLTLEDLKAIPLSIGVAANEEKIWPIYGALRGDYLKTIITDEVTAQGVIDLYR
jgi:DNA-binding transcriptional regulator LsrR (DeoR family)